MTMVDRILIFCRISVARHLNSHYLFDLCVADRAVIVASLPIINPSVFWQNQIGVDGFAYAYSLKACVAGS